MPTTDAGKTIAGRNATTHGLFARDVVLPSLGEDPQAYHQLQHQWMQQLPPRTLLEQHYVEKIAAASWRLRRLHRWQAQLFEDDTLTEGERIDRLDKVLRHETALHRQIDTAVKMLGKDAPQLFARRAREQVQEDLRMFERECRENVEDEMLVALGVQDRLSRVRKATEEAAASLSAAPLDTGDDRPQPVVPDSRRENCQNELPLAASEVNPANEANPEEPLAGGSDSSPALVPPTVNSSRGGGASDGTEKCENELLPFPWNSPRLTKYLDLDCRPRLHPLSSRR